MLGHQNVSNDLEAQFASQLAECLHPAISEFFGIERPDPAVRASGQEMEVVQTVVTPLPHSGILQLPPAAYIANPATYAPPADLAGDITALQYPHSLTTSYQINGAQQITQIGISPSDADHPNPLIQSITYTPWGAISSLTDGCAGTGCTQIQESYSYNNRLQLTRVQLGTAANNNAYNCFVYNYYPGQTIPTGCAQGAQGTGDDGDVAGYYYRDSINPSLSHTAAFTYDALNRLVSASASPTASGTVSYSQAFNYTGDTSNGQFGNVSCSMGGSGYCPQLSFDSNTNRMTGIGTFTPTYNADGDLLTDVSNTYTYDAENRLNSAAGRWSAVYNALGQRVEWQDGNVVDTVYGADGADLGHYDVTGSFWREQNVLFEGRTLVYFSEGGEGTRFFHVNALGSVGFATRPDGTPLEAMLYYPFGSTWQDTTGAIWDERFAGIPNVDADIQLYRTPSRQYSPGLGRWMTPDPDNAGADVSNPQSWNAYSYAGNSPINNIDPSGLYCVQDAKGNWYDDGNGGETCADAAKSDVVQEKNPSVTVTAKPGNAIVAVATNTFLTVDNIANDFFAPLVGMRPSYMQDIPTGSGVAAAVGKALGLVGTAMVGPDGEAEEGIRIAEGRLTKVLESHSVGGLLSGGKSLFDNPDEVKSLIQAAKSTAAVPQTGRFAGKFERIVDAGKIIGTDRSGARTSIYTVITDSDGNLVTAFPGRP